MNKYEEIRKEIDIYLMKWFKQRLSFVYFTPDNVINTRRNSRVDLYLHIRKMGSLFRLISLIIARINFRKEHIGHGSHFVRFLSEIALKYGFRYIGIVSVNDKSKTFTEKLDFYSIDCFNYTVSIENLIFYQS